MVAPAVCEGHIRRSLVRIPGRGGDPSGGAMVVDLSRVSPLAAMFPVSQSLSPALSAGRPRQQQPPTPSKDQPPNPWATSAPQAQRSSVTGAQGTQDSTGSGTPEEPAAAATPTVTAVATTATSGGLAHTVTSQAPIRTSQTPIHTSQTPIGSSQAALRTCQSGNGTTMSGAALQQLTAAAAAPFTARGFSGTTVTTQAPAVVSASAPTPRGTSGSAGAPRMTPTARWRRAAAMATPQGHTSRSSHGAPNSRVVHQGFHPRAAAGGSSQVVGFGTSVQEPRATSGANTQGLGTPGSDTQKSGIRGTSGLGRSSTAQATSKRATETGTEDEVTILGMVRRPAKRTRLGKSSSVMPGDNTPEQPAQLTRNGRVQPTACCPTSLRLQRENQQLRMTNLALQRQVSLTRQLFLPQNRDRLLSLVGSLEVQVH